MSDFSHLDRSPLLKVSERGCVPSSSVLPSSPLHPSLSLPLPLHKPRLHSAVAIHEFRAGSPSQRQAGVRRGKRHGAVWAQRRSLRALGEDVRCFAQVPARGGETEEQRYGESRAARSCPRDRGLQGTGFSVSFALAGQEEITYMVCDWLSLLMHIGGGGSRVILLSCMSHVFQRLDFLSPIDSLDFYSVLLPRLLLQ